MGRLHALWKHITGTYTVTRTASNGYDSHGRAIAGTVSTFSTPASVQPMTGRELLLLPEAQRGEETQWFFSPVEMRTRSATTAPDVVTIAGESWTVNHVESWYYPVDGGRVWRCRIARRNIP
jgi:hypothetical protein